MGQLRWERDWGSDTFVVDLSNPPILFLGVSYRLWLGIFALSLAVALDITLTTMGLASVPGAYEADPLMVSSVAHGLSWLLPYLLVITLAAWTLSKIMTLSDTNQWLDHKWIRRAGHLLFVVAAFRLVIDLSNLSLILTGWDFISLIQKALGH